jgi:hypothetical protein
MSKHSKAKREQRKKKSGPRITQNHSLGGSVYAILRIDGAVFASLGKVGAEWALLVGGEEAMRSADAAMLVGVMQAIELRAEDKGSETSIQASAKLQPMLGGPESDAAEAQWEAHAARILKAHPLPGDAAPKRSLMQRVRDLLA